MTIENLVQLRGKTPLLMGQPVYYAIDWNANRIELFPAPAKNGTLTVRYAPPLLEA